MAGVAEAFHDWWQGYCEPTVTPELREARQPGRLPYWPVVRPPDLTPNNSGSLLVAFTPPLPPHHRAHVLSGQSHLDKTGLRTSAYRRVLYIF